MTTNRHEDRWTFLNDQGHENASAMLLLWYHFVSLVDKPLSIGCHNPNSQLEAFAKSGSGIVAGDGHKRHKNTNCDFCAFCGEPALLTRSHPILRKAKHHVRRKNDLPRCEFCKKLNSSFRSFVSIRGSSFAFVDIVSAFPSLGGSLLRILHPLNGPS